MGARYFKNGTVYVAIGNEIQITAYIKKGEFSIASNPLSASWHIANYYEEITRQEFMDAYLPIAEKMNNKIAEL